MSERLKDAQQAYDDGEFDKSHEICNTLIETGKNNTDALLLRAKINYNQQNWGDSLNDLNRIIELDANNDVAINYKKMVMEILSFWHKDSYNP